MAACTDSSLAPAPIEATDNCDFCRMVISDLRYASEVVYAGGNPYKFDDIGCMRRFLAHRQSGEEAIVFVHDFETQAWIPGSEAWFVRSAKLATPMSGGIVAFSNRNRAQAFAAKNRTEPVRYSQLPPVEPEEQGAANGW